MKAWVLHGIENFQLEDIKEPVLKDDEVLVAVQAAGICGSDIPRIYHAGAHCYPLIPGHEFSGIVIKTGMHIDASWNGRRVGVFPLIPCGGCPVCVQAKYEMCRHYSYLGSRRNGGFAEYVAVPADNLLLLPDNISYEEAAMLEPMAVVVHAMRRMMSKTDERVLICGLGTIGMLLLLFLKEAGIQNVYVVGNKDVQKLAAVRAGLSEDRYCDSASENVKEWIMDRTGGVGVDVFYECVGKNETVSLAVDVAAPGGGICLLGNPHTNMILEKSVYWKILRNQLTITGTWNSSFLHKKEDDWHYAMEKVSQKRIMPTSLITHRISLEEIGRAVRMMDKKTEDYMKVMAIFERSTNTVDNIL